MGMSPRFHRGVQRALLSVLAPALFALSGSLPLPAEAAAPALGGVLATGFASGPSDLDYLKGSGSGFFLTASARTEYRLWQFRSARDEVISRHPLWQSFRFAIRDDHPRRRISFESALRGGGDLRRPGFRAEVLYAWVDLAPASRWSSLRLGRQLLAVGGADGLLRFDGVLGRFNLHHLGIEAYGGVPLRSRFFVLPDDEENVTGWGRDWTYGVALRLQGLRFTQARVGFQERFRDGELARRQLTFDFHKGVAGRINIDAGAVLDLLQRRLEELQVGIDVRPTTWLGLGVGYQRWHGGFDANELFSVFATDPYDAVAGQLRLRPVGWLSLRASGGVQVYPEPITRDNVPRPEIGSVSGTQRFAVRVQPLAWLSLELGERLIMGTGGDKQSLYLSLQLASPRRRVELRLRGDLQHYGFDLQPQLAGDYGSASVDLKLRPVGWLRVGLSGRAVFSPWLENQLQVAATLDLLLGVRRIPALGQGTGSARLEDWQPALLVATKLPQAQGGDFAAGLVGGIGLGGQQQ
jgi:hypothetical protein